MSGVRKLLCSDQASWVFDHNITWEDDIWKADPFDVLQVHQAARKKFEDLLFSVTEGGKPVQTRILMFQGQSGAGKTHLIRALRTMSHCADKGYFGYAQMTPDVSNYAEYYLRRLINSLEKPYSPITQSENSLIRLSNALALDAELISVNDLDTLREAVLDADELAHLIIDLADGVVLSTKFCNLDLDINIIRALLYLQRNDPRIDQRVRQYLYGRQLNELSLRNVAALDPNDGQDRAFEIIESLGRIIWTTQQAALVFCIDQVEDLRFFDDAEERFQKAIRDLIQIANRVSSGIILLSCLDDFYFQMRDFLPQSFIDRIEKAGPVLLRESRTAEEAKLILERRLGYVTDQLTDEEEKADIAELTSLFGENFFEEMAGLSTRRLLEAAEIRRREVSGEGGPAADQPPIRVVSHESIHAVQQRWERFVLDHQAEIPSDEDELVSVLTTALLLSQQEGDDGPKVTVETVAWIEALSAIDLTIEQPSGGRFESRLFICNKRSQGGSLKRQIEKVMASTDNKNAVILRASDFPPNARSATGQVIRQFVASGGQRLVIPIYEWERMITLQEFCDGHKTLDSFSEWLAAAKILRELPSIRQMLRLENADVSQEPVSSAKAVAAGGSTTWTETNGKTTETRDLRPTEPQPENHDNVHHLDFKARSSQPSEDNKSDSNNTSDSDPDIEEADTREADKAPSNEDAQTTSAEQLMSQMESYVCDALPDLTPAIEEVTSEAEQKTATKSSFWSFPWTSTNKTKNEEAPLQPSLAVWPEASPNELKVGRVLGTADDTVAFPINTLKRHAAVLGGSGSGKTTLALSVIEQLLSQKVPVVLIDRKGDLSSYANPDVWEEQAYGREPQNKLRQKLKDEIDVAVYTPGRISGRPISITLLPNGIADLPAHERQQLANVSAAALGDMLHLGNSATHQRQGGILTVGLRLLGETSAREVTLADLIALLEDDYTELVDETQRMDPSGKLRRDLVAQLDSLRHRNWALFEGGGEPLLMDSLLGFGKYATPDKTRLSIVYTGFLGDNENILFWVAQFLSEALRFCQRNPNEDLQAVIMFDEADLYIPANSKPATKEPLESLLKRARSAGIGLMLATQSPGDLDYKSRDQITSWFIGKVREDTALKKLKAAFSSETGIDPASALPNQRVGEFHLIQEGVVMPMKANMSLIQAEQVPFDRIEKLSAETNIHPMKRKKQFAFDF